MSKKRRGDSPSYSITRHDVPTRALLRGGALGAAAATLLCVVVTVPWRGGSAIWSTLAGAAIAVAFFVTGVLAVSWLVRSTVVFSMVGAVTIFFTQALVLLIILGLLSGASGIDRPAFALGATAVTLAWQAGASIGWSRARHQVYAVALPGDSPSEAGPVT